MILFSVHLSVYDEHHVIDYETINDCMIDTGLAGLLDDGGQCEIRAGGLRLTGRPITTPKGLYLALATNASTILRNAL